MVFFRGLLDVGARLVLPEQQALEQRAVRGAATDLGGSTTDLGGL